MEKRQRRRIIWGDIAIMAFFIPSMILLSSCNVTAQDDFNSDDDLVFRDGGSLVELGWFRNTGWKDNEGRVIVEGEMATGPVRLAAIYHEYPSAGERFVKSVTGEWLFIVGRSIQAGDGTRRGEFYVHSIDAEDSVLFTEYQLRNRALNPRVLGPAR